MGLGQSCALPVQQFWVESADAGTRLDVWLHQVCDAMPTRSFAAHWIEAGHVKTSRGQAKPAFRVRLGDRVNVVVPEPTQGLSMPEPEAGIALRVLFEDEHVLVINKQPGLVVHPGAGVTRGTLVNAVLAHCGTTLPSLGDEARAGIVHRLDRDTSGVMVVAKTQVALSGLGQQFARHEQQRRYLALCYGELSGSDIRLETGHGRDARHRTKFCALPAGEGRRAVTKISSLEVFSDAGMSLVQCSLETGRTHQIRVHLSHLGHSLVGDALYGRMSEAWVRKCPEAASLVRKQVNRQLLHAALLGFKHPQSGVYCEFEAPLEPDFANVLASVRDRFA